MILKTAKLGNPILKEIATPVQLDKIGDVRSMVSDMVETLEALGERIGLAAPQVFIPKRFFIYRIPLKKHSRYQVTENKSIPLTVVINPEITPLSNETNTGWEACISVPGYMGMVERYTHVSMSYYDEDGKNMTIEASHFHARVLQHENDHLNGICYVERMKNFSYFGTEEEILKSFEIDPLKVA